MKEKAPASRRSSAISGEYTLETLRENLRTKAPYVPIGLCSLSLLITGVEPASDLLEYSENSRFTVTENEVYANMKIEPKLFSGADDNTRVFKPIISEIITTEKNLLKQLEEIEKELDIISKLEIGETKKRFIQDFLIKFRPIVEGQKQLCAHIPSFSADGVDHTGAANFFLALYGPESFSVQTETLFQFIGNINDWFKMDVLMTEHRTQPSLLPTVGAMMLQMLSRRLMPATELLKVLKPKNDIQRKEIGLSHKKMASLLERANMLKAFKEDGYMRPKGLEPLTDTYFNAHKRGTLSHFLGQPDNIELQEAFVKFIAESDASARLQFFMDISLLLKKKPWYVSDLQLLAPYFSAANPLKLQPEVLTAIQGALYANDSNASAKIKQIVTALLPVMETVSNDVTEMLKAFLAAPNLASQLSEIVFKPADKVKPTVLRSANDSEIRNKVATDLFKREIEKQVKLLEDADIFHEACFNGLVDKICHEMLTPLLEKGTNETRFLSCYAKLLLQIPSHLLLKLVESFTPEKIEKGTILSYTFCSELNPNETALRVQSLKECLLKKAADYNTANHEFLAQVEKSASVFELFNLVKEHSDSTLYYIELKKSIRFLNETEANLFGKRQKSIVPKTTMMCRVKGGKPLENNPGLETPSNTATPGVVEKPKDHSTSTFCTPLKTTSPFPKDSSPTKTGFTSFIRHLKKHTKWDVSYTKKEQGKLELCNDAPYDFVRAYDETEKKLIFTAEKDVEQKQWTVAAYSHEKKDVDEIVSSMAKAVKPYFKADSKATLDIAITASEADAIELLEIYVGAAIKQGFFPNVTLNEEKLTLKKLSDKLQHNKELAAKVENLENKQNKENEKIWDNAQKFFHSTPPDEPEVGRAFNKPRAQRALRF